MRIVTEKQIIDTVSRLLSDINFVLSDDVTKKLEDAVKRETSPLAGDVLTKLQDNLLCARENRIPVCQDTGMAVIFMEIGQEVHFTDGNLEEAINEGVRQGYIEGFLRKSVVSDPLIRENTKDNTPAVIH